jgi:predicted enzyme related to lactoylglutathione lyase
MTIHSMAFTVYPVAEMERSRRFYEEKLGLMPGDCFEGAWCEYDVGGGTFAITTIDMGHAPGAKGAVVGFEVDDLDSVIMALKTKAVSFVTDVMETPVCRMAVIEDPDGNHLTIHKSK